MRRCTICFDNNASEAEVITDTKKSRKVNHQIHSTTWAKCKVLNLLVRNAETNFGRQSLSHHYVPVSTLEECVVKVVKENGNENCSQDNLRLERTRCNTPKYKGTQNSDVCQACLWKPRVICRRGTLTQFHKRVAIGRTRIYKDKQYMKRIQEFKCDAQPSQTHHFIAKEFIKKDQQEDDRYTYMCRFLIASKKFK